MDAARGRRRLPVGADRRTAGERVKQTGLLIASGLVWLAMPHWASPALAEPILATADATRPAIVGQAASVPLNERSWMLRVPLDAPVAFQGALGNEGVDVGGGGMLYPAPNVAGFLAAVITHGLIVEAQKSKRARDMQAAADKVLEPYRPALSDFSHEQLAQSWLADKTVVTHKALRGVDEPVTADSWLIEALPVYTLAQDQRSVTLDLIVAVREPGEPNPPRYQRRVSIVSAPRVEADGVNSWLADRSGALRDTSRQMFAESLNIALRMMNVDLDKLDAPFRTIRYTAGTTERMERAQLLEARCGRMLIKTLRGTLMSVPASDPSVAPCRPG